MEGKAADALLHGFADHQASDAFTCRVVWEPDTLIWDQHYVLTMHYLIMRAMTLSSCYYRR